jgi:hypothetical protein
MYQPARKTDKSKLGELSNILEHEYVFVYDVLSAPSLASREAQL